MTIPPVDPQLIEELYRNAFDLLEPWDGCTRDEMQMLFLEIERLKVFERRCLGDPMSQPASIIPPLSRIPHNERCRIDRMVVGSCFHDAETGERVDPPAPIPGA